VGRNQGRPTRAIAVQGSSFVHPRIASSQDPVTDVRNGLILDEEPPESEKRTRCPFCGGGNPALRIHNAHIPPFEKRGVRGDLPHRGCFSPDEVKPSHAMAQSSLDTPPPQAYQGSPPITEP